MGKDNRTVKELVALAKKLKQDKWSIPVLQRRLHIGYEKAEEVFKKINI